MEKTTVKIFIASSAEMKEERKHCILFFNQISKSRPHLTIEPIEWEYDIVHGNNPKFSGVQKAINPLLKDSHLCLFLFHSKIGKYTKEEFELASQLKKKIIPFFKEEFTPKTKEEIAKWSELLEFKESFDDSIIPRIYQEITDFETKLKDDLHLYLSQEFKQSSNENKQLSPEIGTLVKIIHEKEQKNQELSNQLELSKDIQEQQAKDKKELEERLEPQIAKDNLKKKALKAIQENNYNEAEILLKESAKDSISETASTFYELGKLKKVQLLYQEALHYFELAVKIKPDDFDMNMEAGIMLRDIGNYSKAILHFEKAKQLFETTFNLHEESLSYVYNELGLTYNFIGEYNNGLNQFELSLEILLKYSNKQSSISTCYNNIGLSYYHLGEYNKAIDYYKLNIDIDKKLYHDERINFAVVYNNLGLAYDENKEYDKAIYYYKKSLAIVKKNYRLEHPEIAIRFNNLGAAYDSKKLYSKAIKYYNLALSIELKIYGDEHPKIARRYNNLGRTYYSKNEYQKAIDYVEKALAIRYKFLPENHPNIINSKVGLALAKEALKNSKK